VHSGRSWLIENGSWSAPRRSEGGIGDSRLRYARWRLEAVSGEYSFVIFFEERFVARDFFHIQVD
jgi:hypothetical protein